MSKAIGITYKIIRVPEHIEVDGVVYPRTRHNLEVVQEYVDTDDENVLDKLNTMVISFE